MASRRRSSKHQRTFIGLNWKQKWLHCAANFRLRHECPFLDWKPRKCFVSAFLTPPPLPPQRLLLGSTMLIGPSPQPTACRSPTCGPTTTIVLEMAYPCCFSWRVNLDFLDFCAIEVLLLLLRNNRKLFKRSNLAQNSFQIFFFLNLRRIKR